MNISALHGTSLEAALKGQLEKLLAEIPWLQGTEVLPTARDEAWDLEVRLPRQDGDQKLLCVEVKKEMRPINVPSLAERIKGRIPKDAVFALALPWVSTQMAELCQEHGWSWFDLAGNYRIDVPGLLRLSHWGNPPVHEPPRPKANLHTTAAAWVIRALLHPDWMMQRWTQRSLWEHCKSPTAKDSAISLGLVNKMVRHLVDEMLLEELGSCGFRVKDPVKLLFAWRDAYRFSQHERLSYFTLLHGKKLQDALFGLDVHAGGRAAYAAFSAADFLAPHVRQPKTWLYLNCELLSSFERLLEAERVNSGENVVVLLPKDDGVFYLGENVGAERMRTTSLVQTYVDLWHCGGRGQEAAEALLNQKLIPTWRAAGVAR